MSLSSQILHPIYKTIHEFSKPQGIQFHAFPVRVNANQYNTGVICVLKDGNSSFVILITRFFFCSLAIQTVEAYKWNHKIIRVSVRLSFGRDGQTVFSLSANKALKSER